MRRTHLIWAVGGGIALAALIAVVQVATIGNRTDSPRGGTPAYYEGLAQAGTSLGSLDAPVVVEEYFDFQCPHCHDAVDEIIVPLVDKYVRTGKARFVYRFFPILGPESVTAARGAYCAAKEEAFWPFQHRLMERRGTGNRGAYTEERLVEDARALSLDVEAFEACLRSDDSLAYVQAWFQYAVDLGLRGTPMFAVNGRIVSGTLESLEQAIEEAL